MECTVRARGRDSDVEISQTRQHKTLTGSCIRPRHLSTNALLSSLASPAIAHPRRMQAAVDSVRHREYGADSSLRRVRAVYAGKQKTKKLSLRGDTLALCPAAVWVTMQCTENWV